MPSTISHLIIRYQGNKFREYNDFKDYINFNNINNIIEPFCGSAAISFNIWLEHKDKFNYYINDKDISILNHFNYIKNNDIDNIINRLNIEKKEYNTQEKFKELYNSWLEDKDEFKFIILNKLSYFTLSKMIIYNSIQNQLWQTKTKVNKYQRLFQEFLRSPNVFITNDDWSICYDKFKDDEKALILFDPPYIDTNNSFYKKNCRSFDIYNQLNDIKNNKSKNYFILQKNDKIDNLFKDWNMVVIYDKIYIYKLKKAQHIVYSN